MRDFIYSTPTKVYFGKDRHRDVGSIVKEFGFKRVMLLYGKGSVIKSGVYDEVLSSLTNAGAEVFPLGGVQPNPTLSFAREAVAFAKENAVDLILALGGGSVIDTAKYTAVGAANDCDIWDFATGKEAPKSAVAVACILTIAAAGSEMSSSAVITNEELNMKRGFNSELLRCRFAICNPELTFSLSKYQTACGIVDIMSHTMERYFTLYDPTPLTDAVSEGILRSVVSAAKIVMENPQDYSARADIMWASSLSHNGLTNCGRELYLAVHQLEHALSGEFEEIPHGAGLAVLFPAWGRYVYKKNISRFAGFAKNVWGVECDDDEKAALLGIEAMAEFFKSIGMPSTLKEFGIAHDCLGRLADICTFGKTRTIKTYIELDYDRVKEIFESCY